MKVLHFTLGPVQGFVAQARRTRDLWSGSFLLSYLAGCAMKAVIDAGGSVVFPAVQDENNEPTDDLLKAIMGASHNNPGIGSLPNRFKAEVPEGFKGGACERAVQEAWEKVAGTVWERYVEPAADSGNGTKEIWDRQVRGFWEMSWVVGAEPGDRSDNAWLDRRKNWRTHRPPVEPGDKCTLMSNWQEISGCVRSRERTQQERFWSSVRERVGELNLGEHERLCAIAIIKRLFPDVAGEAIGWELEATRWPSTPYMAAVPWIEEAYKREQAEEYLRLVETSEARRWAFGEYNADLECLEGAGRFARLDGNFFHRTALENENATPHIDKEDGSDKNRQKLLEKLDELDKAVGHSASPFYALLLMDGDSLGRLLQTVDSRKVSRALARFTAGVDGTIREHCGKTVYAGGDDVLALLPLDRALAAGTELRQSYLKAFDHVLGDRRPPDQETGKPLKTTISAGLVYAHYHTSLRAVMREAHRLLDEVAKDRNGRDSIAASVLTGSGRTVEWVSSWTEKTTGEPVTRVVEKLSESFEEQFASRFFYNVRRRFEVLTEQGEDSLAEGLDAHRLLVAEYQKSCERDAPLAEAEDRVERLLRVCRVRRGDTETEEPDALDLSGAMLVRFLATKGKGVER